MGIELNSKHKSKPIQMTDTKFIIQLAILSRILVILLQAVSNFFIPDHDANVFISPKSVQPDGLTCHSIVKTLFGGFRCWDAEYFLHIAEHGYTYENTLVFYPLFPFCVRYFTQLVHALLPIGCEFGDLSLVVAILFNTVFFINAALVLHQLTVETFNNHRLARIATTLFCFNPASIFFSAPYTESLYCWLSFSVMLHSMRNNFQSALLPLALGMWCRSNGVLNFGFVLYHIIRDACINRINVFKALTKVSIGAIVAGASFIIIQAYFFSLYCEGNDFEMNEHVQSYGLKHGFILAGQKRPVWCSYDIPYSYQYLQSYYWDVGFLKYYEFKQIPNFALATPILCMIISHSIHFLLNNEKIVFCLGFTRRLRNIYDVNQFVYIVHALALSIFCVFFVHIQVSTRMLASSTPYIYWICAQHFYSENHANSSKAFLQPKSVMTKFIKAWFLGYFVIGTVLFSNFLPWT